MEGIAVRDVKSEDFPEIVEINHTLQYPKRTNRFLVCRRSVGDFNNLLRLCARFLVAEIGGKVVGYLIALDDTKDLGYSESSSFYTNKYRNFIFIG